jgi:hypothetical protein
VSGQQGAGPSAAAREPASPPGAAEADTALALARLEAAVERLAIAAARPRPALAGGADSVPRAQVQAIADRLDETIVRLRAALGEDG